MKTALLVVGALALGCGASSVGPGAATMADVATAVDSPLVDAAAPVVAAKEPDAAPPPSVRPTPSDAAPPAAPDASRIATDACPARFCDDFEAHTVGGAPAAPWQVSTVSGKVQVDDTRAFSGKRAIRVTVEPGTYRRAFFSVKGAPIFPLPDNVMYGRFMYWLTSAPVVRNVHWTNIQGEGPVPGRSFRGFYRYGGQLDKKLMANYDTSGHDADCWQRSSVVMPEKRWACIEWRFNGPNNEMNYWLDGTPIPELTVVNKGEGCGVHNTQDLWLAPTFDIIRLGWEHFQTSAIPFDMWIDDVAIGAQRIGCPKPAP